MDLVTKFDEIKELLKELTSYIFENNDTNITDEVFQIKKINATINELKKNSISVPDELIKLKLSLSSQIDKVKDAERLKKELIKLLELHTLQLKELVLPNKPAKKDKYRKSTIQERVNLADLLNVSILPSNIELYAYYKNNRYSATLLSNGSLEMTVKKKKKIFENPRSAATTITGYQIDAWKFWKLDFEGKPLTLDDYRKKYLKKKQDNVNKADDVELETEI
jgi:hypothetical protein